MDYNINLNKYNYDKIKHAINNIKDNNNIIINTFGNNKKSCYVINDSELFIFGSNQRFLLKYIKYICDNNNFITTICYASDKNDYNIPLLAYICNKYKLNFELYLYDNKLEIDTKILKLISYFKDNIKMYNFKNREDAEIGITNNSNIYKFILNKNFDDYAVNLIYNELNNEKIQNIVNEKIFIWIYVKSTFIIRYILKLFKNAFLMIVLYENNNEIINFIENINKIIGYRIKIINRLTLDEEIKTNNNKNILNNDSLLFLYWQKYGNNGDYIFNSISDKIFITDNNEDNIIKPITENNKINTNGKLIKYNKIDFAPIRNKINNIFSPILNEYYIKDHNSYIYTYNLNNKPIMICLIAIKEFALIRLVKANEQIKGGGYCSFFITKVIENIYKNLNINLFVLYVDINNLSAVRCYTKIGFIINGIIYFHNIKYYKMEYYIKP